MTSALPFDDIRHLVKNLPDGNPAEAERVRARFKSVEGLHGLGAMAEHAGWLANWSGRAPGVRQPLVAIFAGTHGVVRALRPQPAADETAAMVERFASGTAALNQICVLYDLGLKVFDLALDLPTPDIASDDAFDERDCAATMAFGMEAIAGGADLLCLSALGAGNTFVAAGLLAALHGDGAEAWLGPEVARDVGPHAGAVLEAVLTRHQPAFGDPLEVLRRMAGREFAAVAGAILAARMEKIPVILDGFAATAAAAVLHAMNPDALDHCLLAEVPANPRHRRAAERLNLRCVQNAGGIEAAGVAGAMAAGLMKSAAQVWGGVR